MQAQKRSLRLGLKLALILYPSFYLQDYFLNPDYRQPLLIIRISVTLVLLLAYNFIDHIKGRLYFPVIFTLIVMVSFSLTLIGFITGEGFASVSYTGLLQVMLVSLLFIPLGTRDHALIMVTIAAQHFTLMSFLPWQFADLLTNILAFGIFAIVSIPIHAFHHSLMGNQKTRRDLTPICSGCKKIRNEAGEWHPIDEFFHTQHGIDFSHGICPECKNNLYPFFSNNR